MNRLFTNFSIAKRQKLAKKMMQTDSTGYLGKYNFSFGHY